MGSAHYIRMHEKESVLRDIVQYNYNYIVRLTGTEKDTNEERTGGYELFEHFDEKKIRDYANKAAEENNLKLSKIEVISLKQESVKEIKL
jgi:hypothetical protein